MIAGPIRAPVPPMNTASLLASPVATWPPTPGHRGAAALFVVTADHRVCAANETATAWFDPPSTMLPLARFLGIPDHDERKDELLAFAADLKAHRVPRELRLTLSRANLEIFSALLMATPLADSDGNHLGFDAVLLDLSRWADRSALVPPTHDESMALQLDAAQRSLGVMRRELERFSQVLGHDMRAPIRHVLAFLRLARERLDTLQRNDDALSEYFDGVQKAAHRLNAMIEAMHDYLHLCRARLNVVDVPLGPLVQGVLAHLQPRSDAPAIDWQVAPDLPTVRGDPMLLAQAFRYLLDNAVKFTRPVAHPRITLGWARAADGKFHFRVEDNGVGFDRQHADKLFLLFQRQHHSSDFDGLGVGLAMTHRIVERHGGELFCDSSPNAGCRIHFTLPDGRLDGPGVEYND